MGVQKGVGGDGGEEVWGVQGRFGGDWEVWVGGGDLGVMGRFWGCGGDGEVWGTEGLGGMGRFGGAGKVWRVQCGDFGVLTPPFSPPHLREVEGDVFVELDVGSEGNGDEAQLGGVLRDLVAAGSIASYLTSPYGFQFRRLGAGER